MPTATTETTIQKPTLPSAERSQQEMMIMRETDQWMAEHYRNRA